MLCILTLQVCACTCYASYTTSTRYGTFRGLNTPSKEGTQNPIQRLNTPNQVIWRCYVQKQHKKGPKMALSVFAGFPFKVQYPQNRVSGTVLGGLQHLRREDLANPLVTQTPAFQGLSTPCTGPYRKGRMYGIQGISPVFNNDMITCHENM